MYTPVASKAVLDTVRSALAAEQYHTADMRSFEELQTIRSAIDWCIAFDPCADEDDLYNLEWALPEVDALILHRRAMKVRSMVDDLLMWFDYRHWEEVFSFTDEAWADAEEYLSDRPDLRAEIGRELDELEADAETAREQFESSREYDDLTAAG